MGNLGTGTGLQGQGYVELSGVHSSAKTCKSNIYVNTVPLNISLEQAGGMALCLTALVLSEDPGSVLRIHMTSSITGSWTLTQWTSLMVMPFRP